MGQLVNAIQYVTGPLSLVAFAIAAAALVQRFRLKNPAVLEHEYKLAKSKLTKENYYKLERQRLLSWTWGSGGLAALSLVVWLASFLLPIYWANQPKTQDVDLFARYDGKILDADFVADYHLPNSGPGKADGKGGKAVIRGIPADATKLDIQAVRANGYKPKPDQDYKIEGGKVIIEMVPDTKVPEHMGGADMPNVMPYLPTDDEMKRPPKISDPKLVLLSMANNTSDHLKLLFYNCGKPDNAISRWWIQDLPPNVQDKRCDNIPTGNGWFVAYAECPARCYSCIGTVNVQETDSPSLVIDSAPAPQKYKGTFASVKQSENSIR